MRKKPKRQRKVKEKESRIVVRRLTPEEIEAIRAENRLLVKRFNEYAIKKGQPTVPIYED